MERWTSWNSKNDDMVGCSLVTEFNAVSAMTTFAAALPDDLLYGMPSYFEYDVLNFRVFLYRISCPLRCAARKLVQTVVTRKVH